MNTEQKIGRLRAEVRAALDEFEFVIRLYETWRPAAVDQDLFGRMGSSYASHAFLLIREALAREIVIGLTKLWDSGDRPISMQRIAGFLRSPAVIRALAVERARRMPIPGIEDMLERDLTEKAAAVLVLIDKYSHSGAHRAVHDGLQNLRNKRFAHRQVATETAPTTTPTMEEVFTFYQDMSVLLKALVSLVLAEAYDLQEAAEVHRRYAVEFWTGARGEKTEGHPNYRGLM